MLVFIKVYLHDLLRNYIPFALVAGTLAVILAPQNPKPLGWELLAIMPLFWGIVTAVYRRRFR